MRALLDTNVILDAIQGREPWAGAAQEIFLGAACERFIGCMTAKSCADIHCLVHRCTHSEAAASQTLDKLFVLFELLDTTAMDCKRALASDTTDYEDAIMIETAVRERLDCIVIRNGRNFARAPLYILSPEAFLQALRG